MRPLDDIRVLALEQYGAGPFGSLHLADLGADVIRIESPYGDAGRSVPPYAVEGDSLFFESFNRNKRSIAVDLTSESGRAVFEDLVRCSDVVYSNLRGDVVQTLRLMYADLAPVNPAIVCCSLSGFGLDGPRRAEPAFDYMLQGLCGWMSVTGEPDGPPTKSGLSLVDFSAGLVAACSILAAVHAARRDGVGADCDVSLFDTAIAMLTYVGTWQLSRGHETGRQPQSAHPTLAPFQMFRTQDGWIVAGGSKEKFWRKMTVVLGRPELADDPRFVDFPSRLLHRDELVAEIEAALRTGTTETWLVRFRQAGVPCAPVNSVRQALADPQVAARELVVTTAHPRFGAVQSLASPVRVGARDGGHRRGPRPGEHTDDVLATLCGYSDSDLHALRAAGAIGPAAEGAPEGFPR